MTLGATAVSGLTFEDILEAVQDSKRGRWFLEEFQKRAESENSSKILFAISKIETRIETMAETHGAIDELAKMRNAIATARREIALQEPAASGLSEEGRMFAHLAELARKTLPASASGVVGSTVGKSVVRALTLIDELDMTLNGSNERSPPQVNHPDIFFKADANIFDTQSKPAKPTLVAIASPASTETGQSPVVQSTEVTQDVAKDDEPRKGARLVINRIKAAAIGETAPLFEVENPAIAKAAAVDSTPDQEPAAVIANTMVPETSPPAVPRIVIVRRKPEDMQVVPLTDMQTETAA